MARERSPERDKAKKMWLESSGAMKLKDIATALNVGETQVRKWKSQDKWAADLNSNVTNELKGNVAKRGAPKGNKNAVGNRGGAPPDNQNAKGNKGGAGGPYRNKKALKTGMYETIFMDTLDEDEQELLEQIDTSPIVQAEEQLLMLSLQERRHLKRIKLLEEGMTDEERKIKEELHQRKDKMSYTSPTTGKKSIVPLLTEGMKITEITTVVTSKLDKILKQEEALTKTRDKKIRVINLITNLQQEDEKLAIARERLELEKFKVYGDKPEGDGDEDDGEDDGDDLRW
ncbi:phage terminase small subunit-related protein [Paenibacillus sp. IHBB 10380]|uniref:phage terminase small subunit-related protein n=1 Tax=Paenibacillus sp. IHBB 10380 TaxID=1566358 RepID=UPI0005CFEB44|nr:phage terminase small subunit-related protein [Paenibacillus sp. IHBB 10380]AJS59214.1 terminase [Paenibacillus sp. IHBB 10380]